MLRHYDPFAPRETNREKERQRERERERERETGRRNGGNGEAAEASFGRAVFSREIRARRR